MKKINIISNFNTDIFFNYLQNNLNTNHYKVQKPKFGSFFQQAFDNLKIKNHFDATIIWTQVEEILPSFKKLLAFENVPEKELIKETNDYIKIIKRLSNKTQNLIIFSWHKPNFHRGKYIKDFVDKGGISRNLTLLNLHIAKMFSDSSNIFFYIQKISLK